MNTSHQELLKKYTVLRGECEWKKDKARVTEQNAELKNIAKIRSINARLTGTVKEKEYALQFLNDALHEKHK